MEILVLKFERPISNNKENKIIAAPPPWDAPGKKIFFWISLINMKILKIMFDGLVHDNKENKNSPPPAPWYAPDKKIFFSYFLK